MLVEVYILKWEKNQECREKCTVDFIYLINDEAYACSLIFSIENFEKFRKIPNKHNYLSKQLSKNNYIIKEKISDKKSLMNS